MALDRPGLHSNGIVRCPGQVDRLDTCKPGLTDAGTPGEDFSGNHQS